ncbi:acetyl/propionyl/methylcrotonyl-CoA carboxylase subunit alpha [Actinomadura chokoriensis]|uniref:biotin carboxylase n=1 Tax=Actinomadura chokoriensis TaxID=454156 RepID=A0ABV4R2L6_9ACTN
MSGSSRSRRPDRRPREAPLFGGVLIANRGEIALRVARTCRELGLRVIAVHSTEDRHSAVARYADEAVQVGPAPARRSYLNIPALIEAASRTGAEAIHPGYGFLSEDPDFAEICEASGLTFIGPPAAVTRLLGDKIAARAVLADEGMPVLPGSREPVPAEEAARIAGTIGYPVIVKAAAGGGGRGMHVAADPAGFADAYRKAQAAALTLFGDGRVYVERYLESPRHVEVQVLADAHGNVVSLGERDCTVQRRHQKLVEETPVPALPPELTRRIAEAAVLGARSVGYVGAGTFEFLVDTDRSFYFLEVNCRVQVEHPVTEMVTGIDIVREQLHIAAGRRLSMRQSDVMPRGVAIECRINAEDPERGFAPTPGPLTGFAAPGGPFVRVDTHCFPGYRIPAAYDSLLAKLVVWAPDRPQALARMRRALAEFRVEGPGVRTTLPFLEEVLDHPLFLSAEHGTGLVGDMLSSGP